MIPGKANDRPSVLRSVPLMEPKIVVHFPLKYMTPPFDLELYMPLFRMAS